MNLSIVIVNWNSKHFVKKCLFSIRKHCSDLNPQIIVVDGGSYDGCDAMLAEEFPEVEFVQSRENIGFGRSNNLGVEKAKCEALLFLNPDTEVKEGAIQALLDGLQNLDKAGIVGAKQLNTDGSLQFSSIHRLPRPWRQAFTTAQLHKRYWKLSGALNASEPVVVEAISGACMMMRLDLFRKVGGFSPEFFMYAEDMDLCLKVTQAGYKCFHNPHAIIIHHAGGTSKGSEGVSRFSIVMMREALRLFFLRTNGLMSVYQFRIASFISASLRLLAYSIVLTFFIGKDSNSKQELKLRLCHWWIVLRWTLGLEASFVKSISIPPLLKSESN